MTNRDSNATPTWVEEDLELDAQGRLRPDSDANDLESLRAAAAGWVHAELEPTYVLGQGGTAIVTAAMQHSLDREVAVKALLADKDTPAARLSLVREAKLLSQLDHPGVVPVHFIAPDDGGAPQLVMKRVDGLRWTELIDQPKRFAEVGRTRPAQVEHIRILIRVCEALQYAHTLGVLHRDIKPDNVMVGQHGQVWLMDWGMAVAWKAPADAWLRMAADTRRVSGTPGYLAPEMALAVGTEIGPRTDVYLLGATLHEVLTGAPRHERKDLVEMLQAAVLSKPYTYDDSVPAALAQIANKACSRFASRRFGAASEMLQALIEYDEDRSARRIAEDARDLASVLLKDIDSQGYHTGHSRRIDEVRLTYIQALRLAPNNSEIRVSLQEFLASLIRRALSAGALEVAERSAASLPEPDSDLQEQIRRLRSERADQSAEFQALRDLHDLTTRGRRRQQYFLGVAVASGVWFAGVELGVHRGWWESSHITLILSFSSITAFFGIFGARWIPSETLSQGNVLLRRALMLRIASAVPFFLGAWALGASVSTTTGLQMLLQANHIWLVTLMFVGTVRLKEATTRSIQAGLCYAAASALTFLIPAYPFLWFGLGSGAAQLCLGLRDHHLRAPESSAH